MQLYRGRAKAWAHRYVFLSGYTHLLIGRPPRAKTTPADIQALREIGKNSHFPAVERIDALYARGHALWELGKLDEVATVSSKLISIAEAASEEERAALWTVHMGGGVRRVPAGELIDADVRRAKGNLMVLDPDCHRDDLPSDMQVIHRKMEWPDGGKSLDPDFEMRNAMLVRSAACSHCARGAEDGTLQRCGKCRLAFYCSPECQRANWDAHKAQCRAPGDYVEGDVVVLRNLKARPDLNNHFFRVLGQDAERPGRWRVVNERLPGKPLLSVREDSLQRVLTHGGC